MRRATGSASTNAGCAADRSVRETPAWSSSRSSPEPGRASGPGGHRRVQVGYRDGNGCRDEQDEGAPQA